MASSINLAEINIGKVYRVAGFSDAESPYAVKLHKMGFVEGTKIELAPVKLSDPMVVQIRGSRVALRKDEANHIYVEEVHGA